MQPALPTAPVRPLPSVLTLDPTEEADWDASLAGLPEATFFHTASWARVLKSAYGYRPLYLATRQGSRLASLLPLMGVASWLTGRRGVGLPFTDEVPPLAPDPSAFDALYQEARRQADSRRWKYIELRGGAHFLPAAPASATFRGHTLDLTRGEAALFAGFESSTRRAVRKAEQNGLRIEFSQSLESVRDFHRLLVLTRRRHGVPPQPFSFFASVQRHALATNNGWVVLARHDDRPVAGAVYLHFGKAVLYKYGASDEAFQHLRGNNLVMAEAIRRFAGQGFATLNFGRTDLANEGLRKFKLSWGTAEHPVSYFRHLLPSGIFLAATPPSSGRLARVFHFVPNPVSR
ncbi:MAG: lipid II:glycine glycyltransferase FemX, partial [Opitutaceae bacterium]